MCILKDYQSYDLAMKIMLTTTSIRFWVRQYDGSIVDDGGLATRVLVHLAHKHWGSIGTTGEGRAGDMYPVLAYESEEAKAIWVAHGCNAFERRPPICQPIAFWMPQDLTEYAALNGLDFCHH